MLPVLIHSVNDIERIGDQSENIAELTERKFEEKLILSDQAMKQLNRMWRELQNMMTETQKAFNDNSIKAAGSVLKREDTINRLQDDLKKGHVERLGQGVCGLKAGVVFLDFVDILEKIGDHLTNIAEGVMGEMKWKAPKKIASLK